MPALSSRDRLSAAHYLNPLGDGDELQSRVRHPLSYVPVDREVGRAAITMLDIETHSARRSVPHLRIRTVLCNHPESRVSHASVSARMLRLSLLEPDRPTPRIEVSG
jgi:hypothetical protein